MRIKLATAPSTEPITTAEAKTHCRVDSSTDDTYIDTLIAQARTMAENFTNRAFITQTWDLWLDRFPKSIYVTGSEWWDGVRDVPLSQIYKQSNTIEIPRPPLVSISYLKTYDESDTAATFSSSSYLVDTQSEPGRLALNSNQVWPTTILRPALGINVRFVAGYGAASAVPADIKHALKVIVAFLYENRGDFESIELPGSAKALLDKYRIARL